MMKIALLLAYIMLHGVVAQNDEYDPINWCKFDEEFGPENCPIQRGDYNACVACTSTYFYSCGKYMMAYSITYLCIFCFVHKNALIFLSNGFSVYCIFFD